MASKTLIVAEVSSTSVRADRWIHVDASSFPIESDGPVDEGKQREIIPLADIPARVKLVAYLPHEDIARADPLATKLLDAATLRVGVASVAARSLSFLVRHGSPPKDPEVFSKPLFLTNVALQSKWHDASVPRLRDDKPRRGRRYGQRRKVWLIPAFHPPR